MGCAVQPACLNQYTFSSFGSCVRSGCFYFYVCVLGVSRAFKCNTQGQLHRTPPQAEHSEMQNALFPLRYTLEAKVLSPLFTDSVVLQQSVVLLFSC